MNKKPKAVRLGIDFGTTRTVVAAVENGNYPICTFSIADEVKEYIPTLAAVEKGRLFFGWEAARRLQDSEVYVLRSLKRLIGRARPDDPIEIAPDFSLPALELVSLFLGHVREMILRHSPLNLPKARPLEILAAVPANAGSNQRYLTLEAFRRAGFRVRGLLNEPSAAAVEFVHRYLKDLGPKSPKKYLVVYDLGGGTFDTSVVGFACNRFDVIAHRGISRLGGDDFDQVILEKALEEIDLRREELPPGAETQLLEECRERKEGLKPNTQKMLLDLALAEEVERSVILGTKEIYERCGPLIERSLNTVQQVMNDLQQFAIDPEDGQNFAAVYLVGGSVAFPPVSRRLRELFARKVRISPYPQAATAIGLAVAADPQARVRIRETVSRYFGLWREREEGKEKVFDPIFFQDRDLGSEGSAKEVVRSYRPAHNIGHLRFLECSALSAEGEPRGDLFVWDDVYFPYDPRLRQEPDLARVPLEKNPTLAAQQIRETYTYDRKGIIHLVIDNLTSGYRKEYAFGLQKR
ncbi:MAG: Hsp70 family protein [Deltaproteobacteria bacterium]|nr:Hsp70 family protein [Deltaproteobacteria bacterium]